MYKDLVNIHRNNLKSIQKAITAVNRTHNNSIRNQNKELQYSSLYVLLIMWVAWLETSLDLILWNNICIEEKIRKEVYLCRSLTESWKYLIVYLFRFHYFSNRKRPLNEITLGRTNYFRYLTIIELLEDEIDKTILLRNRLAHGQWKVALNTEKNDINDEATALLNTIGRTDLIINRNIIRNFVINVSNLAHSKKHFEKQYDNRMLRIDETRNKAKSSTLPKWQGEKWIKVK